MAAHIMTSYNVAEVGRTMIMHSIDARPVHTNPTNPSSAHRRVHIEAMRQQTNVTTVLWCSTPGVAAGNWGVQGAIAGRRGGHSFPGARGSTKQASDLEAPPKWRAPPAPPPSQGQAPPGRRTAKRSWGHKGVTRGHWCGCLGLCNHDKNTCPPRRWRTCAPSRRCTPASWRRRCASAGS